MDVVVVGDDEDAVPVSRREKSVVGDRAAERPDPAALQVGETAECCSIGLAHRQHLPKLEVGDRDRMLGPSGRSVFDAGEPDLEIAALDRRVDRGEGDLQKAGLAPEPSSDRLGDFDVEPPDLRRVSRVRLDVGRAPLGVAPPEENGRRRSRRRRRRGWPPRPERRRGYFPPGLKKGVWSGIARAAFGCGGRLATGSRKPLESSAI